MNIYKSKYCVVKRELRALKKSICRADGMRTRGYWEARLSGLGASWERVVAEYLARGCDDGERGFFLAAFVFELGVAACCRRFFVSERTYYMRRERMFNDLLFLAAQDGLIDVRPDRPEPEGITDAQWRAVCEAAAAYGSRAKPDRRAVEGMAYILRSGLPWRAMPTEYGDWNAVYKRYRRWRAIGLWQAVSVIVGIDAPCQQIAAGTAAENAV